MRLEGSQNKFRLPPTDKERFRDLFNILLEDCFNCNMAATARALGISFNTAKGWDKTAPQRYWETHIVLEAILIVQRTLAGSKHVKHRHRSTKILRKLREVGLHSNADVAEANTHSDHGAMIQVLSIIAHTDLREMSLNDLTLSGNSGGYTKRTIRRAAQQLGLHKELRGFGEDKEVWYIIPRPDEL